MSTATFSEFEARARAQGFQQVLERNWAPDTVLGTHVHPFAVEALVVRGDMWLTVGDETRPLQAGDTFTLGREIAHSERYGDQGATLWVARRGGAGNDGQ
jgi:quercetin dioxygenase-like cupin family protein